METEPSEPLVILGVRRTKKSNNTARVATCPTGRGANGATWVADGDSSIGSPPDPGYPLLG